MNISTTADITPITEHGGTCTSYFFYEKEELRHQTSGGYLEFVDEFELTGGAALEPHSHDSDEFYYILRGSAVMRIGAEERPVGPGVFVHIPRNEIHSIRATTEKGCRALAFAISYMREGEVGYTAYPTDGSAPRFVPTPAPRSH